MERTTRLGLAAVGVAVAEGVLADWWLRGQTPGLGHALWVISLVVATAALARQQQVPLAGEGRWLALPVLVLGAAFAWRASPTLRLLDGMAIVALVAVAALQTRAGRIRLAGIGDYLIQGLQATAQTLAGGFLLALLDIRWGEIPRGRWSERAATVGRGLVLAVPLVLLFGALFMAADAVFEDMVTDLIDVDLGQVYTHLAVTAGWAWLVAGYLRGVLIAAPQPVAVQRPAALGLGRVETAIVLGALNALFAAFVAVQFRYLFGGVALVQTAAGLTYAEYARRGFFELVTVAALVLPLLLGVHWLLRRDNPGDERWFRALAGLLVAQLFVIMASAVQRMRLYQAEFGLTELRLYVFAFMAWLAVLFLWFAATVLRGRREQFAFGALMTGWAALVLLHAINPDALIVRSNAARAAAGLPFDTAYALRLSADAAPDLVRALPVLSGPDRRMAASLLVYRWSGADTADWRSWSWARWQAHHAVVAELDALRQMREP